MDQHLGFEVLDVAGVRATLAADAEHDIVGWPTGPHKPETHPPAPKEPRP